MTDCLNLCAFPESEELLVAQMVFFCTRPLYDRQTFTMVGPQRILARVFDLLKEDNLLDPESETGMPQKIPESHSSKIITAGMSFPEERPGSQSSAFTVMVHEPDRLGPYSPEAAETVFGPTSRTSETSEASKASEASEASKASETSEASEASETSETSETSESSRTLKTLHLMISGPSAVPWAIDLLNRCQRLFCLGMETSNPWYGRSPQADCLSILFQPDRLQALFSHNPLRVVMGQQESHATDDPFRLFAQKMNAGIWIIDASLRTVYTNPVMATILGCNPAELRSAHLFRFADSEGREATRRNWERQRRGESSIQPFTFLRSDGKPVETEIHCVPLYDGNGEFCGSHAVVIDVSGRTRREERKRLHAQILVLLNDSGHIRLVFRKILLCLKKHFGFSGIGVRLKRGNDFPFFLSIGLSPEFQNETGSIWPTAPGSTHRTAGPRESLECFCGAILQKKVISGIPVFSPRGSLFAEDLASLLSNPEVSPLVPVTRSHCQKEGFQSLVLIPFFADKFPIGLLLGGFQEKTSLAREEMDFLEDVVSAFGVALHRHLILTELEEMHRELEDKVQVRSVQLRKANVALQKKSAKLRNYADSLEASEKRMRAIVEDQTELICRFLKNGALTFVNEAYCRFFQKSRPELLGSSFFPRIPEEDQGLVNEYLASLSANNPQVTYHHRVIAPTGDIRWMVWRDRAILDEGGEICEFQAVGRDITGQKLIEKALVEAKEAAETSSRAKTVFLSNMSHELRTPLNSVMGFSDLLKGEFFGPLNEKQKEYVQLIEKSGNHLLSLIEDLLDISRMESGRMIMNVSGHRPQVLAANAMESVKSRATEKGIRIQISSDSRLPMIRVDHRRLVQILQNLLSNAVKFSPENSVVDLKINRVDRHVRYSVEDAGPGIKPEDLSALFQGFSQTNRVRDELLGGAGVGLALCKRLVEAMDGQIGVDSEVGHGSRFWFTVPIEESFAADPSLGVSPKPSLPPESSRILVVEDDEHNLNLMIDCLKIHNHEVIVARNGREAVDLTLSARPQLVLLDVHLPVMSGDEALVEIRRHASMEKIPIIAVTAGVDDVSFESFLALGFNDVLTKPLSTSNLFRLLSRFLPKGDPVE
jgi:PAS domain S-box-containing protein